ncbi:uncharacterized protein LOC111705732 isoform X2 [Eurytemora carolleeae]|uniref:uncharacterized protein LOC111705732 isoform X2 n=1 Tax=Eurytemora carolleeae TaxID=1294199 RepID=UPI000C762C82|nr:uncharacterized protein LOC111705732 isoform X2 [Eurytemora carolleeae]|eukprot:XP_023334148.1 uncharacterized protein LOC111705732 isoform X2 [Eurytemora affinis]
MMDSINGLNEMNMDDLAMDEYLRSLDEKRDDEYSFIFNAHLRSAEEEFNRIERAPSASRTGFNQYPEPASDLSSMSDFEAYFKPNRKESIIPDQNKLEQHRMAQIAGRFLYMHPVFFGVSSIPLYVLAVIYLTYSSPDYPGSISSSNSSSTYSSSSLSSTVPLMLIQVWSIWDPIMYSVLSILTRFMFQGSVYKLYL